MNFKDVFVFSVIAKQHVNVLCFTNNINKVVIGKTKSFELVAFIVQSLFAVVIIYSFTMAQKCVCRTEKIN